MDFIEARHWTKVQGDRAVQLIVIHTMEAPEKPGTARRVAQWFAGDQAPAASAHYCIDDREVIQCVRENDVAWAAPGANKNGIHLEHAGYAAQKDVDWQDGYSQAMLARSARLCADICGRYKIPPKRIGNEDLIAGRAGICGHGDVSAAFHKSDHTDPGRNFPWNQFVDLVLDAIAKSGASPVEDLDSIA